MIPARYRAGDMKIELLFPADDATRTALITMFGSDDEATDRKPAQ